MNIPFNTDKQLLQFSPLAIRSAPKRGTWRGHWPFTTIALGAVFTLIWLAGLVLLFVLRI